MSKSLCKESKFVVLEKGDPDFIEFLLLVKRKGLEQCAGIYSSYLQKVLKKSTVLIVAYSEVSTVSRRRTIVSRDLCGFILLTPVVDEPTSIFLQLICSATGQGSKLMIELYRYCCRRKLRLIALHSVYAALDFYRRHGFIESIDACAPPRLDDGYQLTALDTKENSLAMTKCVALDFCDRLEDAVAKRQIPNNVPIDFEAPRNSFYLELFRLNAPERQIEMIVDKNESRKRPADEKKDSSRKELKEPKRRQRRRI